MKVYIDPNLARQRRVEAMMTQAQLAKKARVGLSTIERLERGEEPVALRYNSAAAIAKAMHLRLDDLLDRVEA